ncbi:MAG: hypothetical protein KDA41_13550, partial [Planctomycetales bacterium]|nr:hypothetical protein [Planctomycetales bacterium]
SRSGDGFRPFDAELGGYRYYGIWNGDSGIAAAYYTDGQLPLTFHHEIFHHVDGTRAGVNDASRFFASDDGEFREAIAGERRYVSPLISDDDLAALRRVREGSLLRGAVSDYSAKAAGEDQAETARHFMTTLPDSLVQIVERPDLPGSQRILHCLSQYNEATVDGPDVNWFVDIALGRASAPKAAAGDIATVGAVLPAKPSKEQIFAQIDRIAEMHSGQWEALVKQQDAARQALAAAAEIDAAQLSPEESQRLFEQAAAVTHSLLRARLKATDDYDTRYAIWGTEDASGVNWTLRRDVQTFAADARRLKQLARLSPKEEETLTRAQLKGLRLVARYYAFIDRNWSVSDGTQQVFDAARDAFAESLPAAQSSLASQLKSLPLDDLALRLPIDGAPKLLD